MESTLTTRWGQLFWANVKYDPFATKMWQKRLPELEPLALGIPAYVFLDLGYSPDLPVNPAVVYGIKSQLAAKFTTWFPNYYTNVYWGKTAEYLQDPDGQKRWLKLHHTTLLDLMLGWGLTYPEITLFESGKLTLKRHMTFHLIAYLPEPSPNPNSPEGTEV